MNTDTISRFEAFQLPRGNVVVEYPSKRIVSEHPSMDEAKIHASEKNKWLAAEPKADTRYKLYLTPVEPAEAALIAMIDAPWLYEESDIEVAS